MAGAAIGAGLLGTLGFAHRAILTHRLNSKIQELVRRLPPGSTLRDLGLEQLLEQSMLRRFNPQESDHTRLSSFNNKSGLLTNRKHAQDDAPQPVGGQRRAQAPHILSLVENRLEPVKGQDITGPQTTIEGTEGGLGEFLAITRGARRPGRQRAQPIGPAMAQDRNVNSGYFTTPGTGRFAEKVALLADARRLMSKGAAEGLHQQLRRELAVSRRRPPWTAPRVLSGRGLEQHRSGTGVANGCFSATAPLSTPSARRTAEAAVAAGDSPDPELGRRLSATFRSLAWTAFRQGGRRG
jgi:hypothetical protein